MYTLRPATSADYTWLQELHHSTMRNVVERTWGWNEIEQDNFFRRSFHPDRTQIVQVNSNDVGMIEVEQAPTELLLVNIQISPNHQRQGLGTLLVQELQHQAESRGMAVALRVIKGNQAQALYQRLGFVVSGETETHYLMFWSPGAAVNINQQSQ